MTNPLQIRVVLCAVILSHAALCQDKRLGVIDFFGYEGIDVSAVRSELPFRDGDLFPSGAKARKQWKTAARDAIIRTTGRPPTDIAMVCCTGKGDWMIYIGLDGLSTSRLEYRPVPSGHLQLPADLLKLDAKLMDAWIAAVKKGSSREDHETGYALSSDPALRSKQLQLRELALKYEQQITGVLANSSDSRQRAIAASALGYATQSDSQIAALIAAGSDPESEVRNNAVRALGVLLSAKPQLRQMVPPAVFVGLLCSGSWTDRNKGSFLLLELTASRDSPILTELRAKARQPLVEMARWREAGHADPARMLLGRIAGIQEKRLEELVRDGNVEAIIAAAQEVH